MMSDPIGLAECAAGLIVLGVIAAWLLSKLKPRPSDIDWADGRK